ncbi:LIM domain kinase 1 [Monoraphidium neglectum]|uniref:LIM domain kinase 1 n=1 Tax=Monoraphidium neglectum TaxID=145388 RepID=A0A0D2L663_9CHLO|nr:LIM domain kinase 1 [Monoraphidium neglectum]KIZ02469.1 LIM domain kinase 1 [Monoraphidium neglectum]|eukprot:XP_013901488.1 LIM domain kinase 1 [Monoraphidium neglectum]
MIFEEELKLGRKIGSGAEGEVFLARWKGIQVAAKEFIVRGGKHGEKEARESLFKEIRMLADLTNHPNVVHFCGVCLRKGNLKPLVVTQYYEKGSAHQLLLKAKSRLDLAPPARKEEALRELRDLSWAGRLKMLHNVAAAMMFVHSQGVLHGDLRSPNLFVDSHGKLVVADFGFGETLPQGAQEVSVKVTTNPRWVAPEAMHTRRISKASDVYSFAIIMYEVGGVTDGGRMLTWTMPYHNCNDGTVCIAKRIQDSNFVGVTPEVPQLPPDEQLPLAPRGRHLEQYKQLMTACWDPDPSKRPTFKRVTALLEKQQKIVDCSDGINCWVMLLT